MNVFIIQIIDGGFVLSSRDPELVNKSDLTAEKLAEAMKTSGFDPNNCEHILMCGSSCDFPEDDGAPEGFDARGIIEDAIAVMGKE